MCHVLHRLLAPRHPPYALSSLNTYLPALMRQHPVQLLRFQSQSLPARPAQPLAPAPLPRGQLPNRTNRRLRPSRSRLDSRIWASAYQLTCRPYFVKPSPSPEHYHTGPAAVNSELVEMSGLEPLASSVQRRRSPN